MYHMYNLILRLLCPSSSRNYWQTDLWAVAHKAANRAVSHLPVIITDEDKEEEDAGFELSSCGYALITSAGAA